MRKLLLVLTAFVMTSMLSAQVYYSEDFDACALPAGWTNDTIAGSTIDSVWQFLSLSPNNGTIDGSCFASFDDDNVGSIVGYNGAFLQTQNISFPSSGPVYLEFDYNYNNIGTDRFIIEVFDGTAWITLSSLAADDCGLWTCAAVGEYPHYKMDVSAYANNAFKVRWTYDDDPVGGTDTWAWFVGFDNVVISKPLPDDVGTISVDGPVQTCDMGSSETVTATILNYGSTTVTNVGMTLTVDGSVVATEPIIVSLAPDSTFTYTFTATADLSAPGAHNITVGAQVIPTDSDASNAEASATYENTRDIGVVSLDGLASGCNLSAAEPVTITVQNFGTTSVDNISVGFQVDGGSIVSESISGANLACDSSLQYTFSATADLSGLGLHAVNVFASAATVDTDPANGSLADTVSNIPPLTGLTFEGFDTADNAINATVFLEWETVQLMVVYLGLLTLMEHLQLALVLLWTPLEILQVDTFTLRHLLALPVLRVFLKSLALM